MKLLTSIILLILTHSSIAQISHELEHYLEEKVRDVRVREYITEHALAYKLAEDAGETYVPQGKTPASFMESIGYDADLRGINHEFSVTGGAEPYIAMNPIDSNHLVVTYMSRADADYPIFITLDGGTTWTQSNFSPLDRLMTYAPGTMILGGGDPVLAFDSNGNLHLTYIYAHGSGFPILGGMYYANSTDGGMNFSIPTGGNDVIYEGDVFAGDLLDRQWMHCDNSGGAEDGTLYMSAVYFGGAFGTAGELVLKKSLTDLGFMSNTVAVPHVGGMSTQFGNLKVDGNGDVHMACMEFDGASGDGSIVYTKSTDGGATFSAVDIIAPAKTGLPNNAATHIVHNRDNTATSLAVDGNNVYIAWCDFTGGELRGLFSYSSDNGTSFSTPTEFGVDIFGNGFHHVMPNVAADNGRVGITWYKVDSVTMESEYVMAESDDAGASFSTYTIASTSSTDFDGEDEADFYGDYNCSEKHNCNTYSVFSDGRSGTPVVYFVNENACQLGVKEVSAINGALTIGSLYPNPTNGDLTVELANNDVQDATLVVLDISGSIVLKKELVLSPVSQTVLVDLSNLAAGMYQLKVETATEFGVRSIVKK